jgi:hypothetical protein
MKYGFQYVHNATYNWASLFFRLVSLQGKLVNILDATIPGATQKFGEFKQGAQTGCHMPFHH